MKTLLVAVNSSYVHSNLAVWYLKAACENENISVKIKEFNINQQLELVYSSIITEKPQIVAFSVYIWNMEFVLKLVNDIKKALPNIKIILGGPEVSYNYKNLLQEHKSIDYIIVSGGEKVFSKILKAFSNNKSSDTVNGIAFLSSGKVIINKPEIYNFADVLSPFTDEMLYFNKGKIIYYESSRGCPFSCSYCLSSCEENVQFLPLDRVFNELKKITQKEYELVKFVDRTFNCNAKRAEKLLEFVLKNTGKTAFHFEIAADILSDRFIEILANAPKGKIQLEIGIQTVNEDTLNEINRKTDLTKVYDNIKKLISLDNTHIHVDLIAGLPLEDYNSFKNSFNRVFSLNAHDIQLGFLKLLHGTVLRKNADEYGMIFRKYPPYEIISNKYITAEEIIQLKKQEKQVELFYNSHRFCCTIKYLLKKFLTPFDMFLDFAENIDNFNRPVGAVNQYILLLNYCKKKFNEEEIKKIKELLRFDYRHINIKNKMPEDFKIPRNKNITEEIIYNSGIPEKLGLKSKKDINSRLYLERFTFNPENFKNSPVDIIFDFNDMDELTGLVKYYCV